MHQGFQYKKGKRPGRYGQAMGQPHGTATANIECFVLICWAAQADLTSAVDAALWTTVATIIGIEVVSGVRAELSAKALVAQALIGAALGVLALTLKAVLH